MFSWWADLSFNNVIDTIDRTQIKMSLSYQTCL